MNVYETERRPPDLLCRTLQKHGIKQRERRQLVQDGVLTYYWSYSKTLALSVTQSPCRSLSEQVGLGVEIQPLDIPPRKNK